MALASNTYRIAASLPATLNALPALTAFRSAGIDVSSNFPTLIQYTDPELSEERDRDEVISVNADVEFPMVYVYDELRRETGMRPDLSSICPVLCQRKIDGEIIGPEHRLLPGRFILVAAQAPDIDTVPTLRTWLINHIEKRQAVYTVLKDNCPRIPFANALGTRSDLPGNKLALTPPTLGEVIDMVSLCGQVITTEYWVMYLALAFSKPVEFLSYDGNFYHPYRTAFQVEAAERGWRLPSPVDITVHELERWQKR